MEKRNERKSGIERNALAVSELRFRYLFEAAQEGILLVDVRTGVILDVNTYVVDLLGYPKKSLLGRRVWDIKLFKRVIPSRARLKAFTAKGTGSIHVEIETKKGKRVDVEFVASGYSVGTSKILQCHIRRVAERDFADRSAEMERLFNDAVINSIPGAFFVVDQKGAFVRWNDYERDMILGKPEQKVAGSNALATIHPDDRAFVRKKMMDIFRHGKEESAEVKVLVRGGPAFCWHLLTGRRLIVGKRMFVIGSGIDVTERKKLETDLLEANEQNFRNIFDHAADGILLAKIKGKKFYLGNPAIRRMLGYSEEEISRLGVMDIHPKKDVQRVARLFEAQARGEFSLIREIPVQRKDGSVFFADINATKITINKQEYLMGIFHDNTEHLELERIRDEAREAKEKVILSSIGDGVLACDAHGKIIVFNQVAEKITGFSVDEAIGKNYHQIFSLVLEGTGKPGNDFIAQAIREGKTIQMTNHTLLIKKGGNKVAVADSAAPFFDRDHNVIGCSVVFRDVTREREIDRSKTEFVSLASHQLRTPLTGMNWLTEMLLKGDLGPLTGKQQEAITIVQKSGKRMAELVKALLNVSRLELGTFFVNPKPVVMSKISDDVLEELAFQISKKQITIKKAYQADMPAINADPVLLKMICQNLFANAVHYSYPKTVITVSISNDDKNFLLTVADQGIGIPEEDRSKICVKLFRSANARQFLTDGTGLGLYITKLVLDAVGGKIWFDSVINKGTRFYVTLPIKGMTAKKGDKSLEASEAS